MATITLGALPSRSYSTYSREAYRLHSRLLSLKRTCAALTRACWWGQPRLQPPALTPRATAASMCWLQGAGPDLAHGLVFTHDGNLRHQTPDTTGLPIHALLLLVVLPSSSGRDATGSQDSNRSRRTWKREEKRDREREKPASGSDGGGNLEALLESSSNSIHCRGRLQRTDPSPACRARRLGRLDRDRTTRTCKAPSWLC
ncbi:hypothetical protein J3F83DRAFT_25590 [Trichoderma novae-zelandiae]